MIVKAPLGRIAAKGSFCAVTCLEAKKNISASRVDLFIKFG